MREFDSFRIAGVGMARNTQAWIGSEHALEAARGFRSAIRHDDLPGVDAVANANAAAVMDTDPGGSAYGVNERVQQRPIGDGVGTVAHGFGFPIRAGDRTRIEMITPDHNGRGNFTRGN